MLYIYHNKVHITKNKNIEKANKLMVIFQKIFVVRCTKPKIKVMSLHYSPN